MATSHIVHELIPFLVPLGGQNIIWIVGNLRVSTFFKKNDRLSKLIACSQNWGILQTRMDQKEGPYWKWILTSFKYKNECYKQSWKSRRTKWVACLVAIFSSWLMVRKLSKKVCFLQFCADLSKKSKSAKAIFIYTSESSHHTLAENGMVYRSPSHQLWYISN